MAKKKASGGLARKLTLSPELAAIVGKKSMSRPEITKQIWVYIKKHKLQDPDDMRTIIPDEKLEEVIGSKPINMMQLATHIKNHVE